LPQGPFLNPEHSRLIKIKMALTLPKPKPDQAVIEALNREHGTALIRYFQRRGIAIEQAEDVVA
jgi:hypothetical protein